MRFFTPSLLILALFVIGGIVFKSSTPSMCDKIAHDDSIFVLTGDVRRIPFAIRQLEKHQDTDLYIIGAGATPIAKTTRRITIESESKSTYQNAQAIKEITLRAGLDRIVVITTEDHMNRAKYLIRSELPDNEIIFCAARLTGMPATKRLERWITEYIKYIATMFGIKES